MKNWITDFISALAQAIYFRFWIWKANRQWKKARKIWLKTAEAHKLKRQLHVANCTVPTCWYCTNPKEY